MDDFLLYAESDSLVLINGLINQTNIDDNPKFLKIVKAFEADIAKIEQKVKLGDNFQNNIAPLIKSEKALLLALLNSMKALYEKEKELFNVIQEADQEIKSFEDISSSQVDTEQLLEYGAKISDQMAKVHLYADSKADDADFRKPMPLDDEIILNTSFRDERH